MTNYWKSKFFHIIQVSQHVFFFLGALLQAEHTEKTIKPQAA
jgi:hypothetical protein